MGLGWWRYIKFNPLATLTIAIVNYETTEEVSFLLQSYSAGALSDQINTFFLIIDNNSVKFPIENLRIPSKLLNFVKIVKNRQNLGYAPAITKEMNKIEGDYVLFLNPDINPGDWSWLRELIDFMQKNEDAGVVAPVLTNKKGEVWLGGTYNPLFPTISLGEHKPSMKELNLLGSMRIALPYVWVTGTALLTRTQLFKANGGFDRRLFFYYDEVDYCIRIWLNAYKVYTLTWSKLENTGGLSIKRSPSIWRLFLLDYWDTKEFLYVDKKFFGACPKYYISYTLSHIFGMFLIRPILHSIRYKNPLSFYFTLLALRDFIKEGWFKAQPQVRGCDVHNLIRSIDSERKRFIKQAFPKNQKKTEGAR